MKRTYYRKLIRDKVPEKMRRMGKAFEVRTLTKKDFRTELLKKVGEEASALPRLRSATEIAPELADVLDVVSAILSEFKISQKTLAKAREENAKKKGGFKKRVYLVWSQSDDYTTNERRNAR